MAFISFSLRKRAEINLPLPSGSSPAEKPPGNMTICAEAIRRLISSTDSFNSPASLFRKMKISVSAPARSKALALSISQFVPGMAGIKTFGKITFVFTLTLAGFVFMTGAGISPGRVAALRGKMPPSGFS